MGASINTILNQPQTVIFLSFIVHIGSQSNGFRLSKYKLSAFNKKCVKVLNLPFKCLTLLIFVICYLNNQLNIMPLRTTQSDLTINMRRSLFKKLSQIARDRLQ